MASVCFFASHYAGGEVPAYIRVYLQELSKYFERTILLCEGEPDQASAAFLRKHSIEWLVVMNEGYDFGKWHHGFEKVNVTSNEMVGLINDSCVLFSSLDPFFDWLKREAAEVTGMTKSHSRGEHIQSYFMVLRGPAVALAQRYFAETGVVKDYDEVISKYELGLSSLFLKNGLRLGSFVDNGGYAGEFSPYYQCAAYHIRQGMPMIKKRILQADYRKAELFTLARMNFRISPEWYVNLIRTVNDKRLWDDSVIEFPSRMSFAARIRYEATRIVIQLGKPLKRILKPFVAVKG